MWTENNNPRDPVDLFSDGFRHRGGTRISLSLLLSLKAQPRLIRNQPLTRQSQLPFMSPAIHVFGHVPPTQLCCVRVWRFFRLKAPGKEAQQKKSSLRSPLGSCWKMEHSWRWCCYGLQVCMKDNGCHFCGVICPLLFVCPLKKKKVVCGLSGKSLKAVFVGEHSGVPNSRQYISIIKPI